MGRIKTHEERARIHALKNEARLKLVLKAEALAKKAQDETETPPPTPEKKHPDL